MKGRRNNSDVCRDVTPCNLVDFSED
jgi:hypothetical protein